MMRITRATIEPLAEAMATLEELQELREYMEGWLELQDEPRTGDTRDAIRENREAFEDRLDELADACQAVLSILRPAPEAASPRLCRFCGLQRPASDFTARTKANGTSLSLCTACAVAFDKRHALARESAVWSLTEQDPPA